MTYVLKMYQDMSVLLIYLIIFLVCCIAVFNVNDKCQGYRFIKSKHFTDKNKENFRSRIHQTKEEQLFYCTDISIKLQEKYVRYFSHIASIYNACSLIKTKKVYENTFKKNPGLQSPYLKTWKRGKKLYPVNQKIKK